MIQIRIVVYQQWINFLASKQLANYITKLNGGFQLICFYKTFLLAKGSNI